MSLKNVLTTATAILVLSSTAALAQAPTRIKQFDAWGSYSSPTPKGKLCFILSTPTTMEPASVDHGDIFFMISQKPGEGVSYEPQVKMGYKMQAGGKVIVDIDSKKFTLYAQDDSAWMENAAEEPQLIAALRKGTAMKVDAKSQRGTATHYTYSLGGVTAALQSIATCK